MNLSKKKDSLLKSREKFVGETGFSDYALEMDSALKGDRKSLEEFFDVLKEELDTNGTVSMSAVGD